MKLFSQLVIDKRNRSEKRVISLKKDFNSLNQCGWRNNIVFTGIPDIKQVDQLEETVKFMLSDVDVNLDENVFENCHRIDNLNSKTKL